MPQKWEGFFVIQKEQESELLSQGEGVDSAQPVREA